MKQPIVKVNKSQDVEINISACKPDDVLDFIQFLQKEKKEIMVADTVGSRPFIQVRKGTWEADTSVDPSKHLLTSDFVIERAYNAAGEYRRVVLKHGNLLRIVSIVKNVPTVGQDFMPT